MKLNQTDADLIQDRVWNGSDMPAVHSAVVSTIEWAIEVIAFRLADGPNSYESAISADDWEKEILSFLKKAAQ